MPGARGANSLLSCSECALPGISTCPVGCRGGCCGIVGPVPPPLSIRSVFSFGWYVSACLKYHDRRADVKESAAESRGIAGRRNHASQWRKCSQAEPQPGSALNHPLTLRRQAIGYGVRTRHDRRAAPRRCHACGQSRTSHSPGAERHLHMRPAHEGAELARSA